jgi:hypothetical protein
MSDDTAWPLFFNALPLDCADSGLLTRSGDAALLGPLLRAPSVIV